MADVFDDAFYTRADAHIALSNEQADSAARELVNASMLFASARFCAFLSAGGYSSGEAMAANYLLRQRGACGREPNRGARDADEAVGFKAADHL